MDPTLVEKVNRNARRMHRIIVISLVIDLVFLLAFSSIGLVAMSVVVAYGTLAIGFHAILYWMSKTGINRTLKEPGLALLQALSGIAIQVGFLLVAPQIGLVFLFNLFTVYAFCVVVHRARQFIFLWLFGSALVLAAMWKVGAAIVFPNDTDASLFLISAFFVVTVGRAILIMEPISRLRSNLVKRNRELSAAFVHAEKMATCDALTNTLNRRAMIDVLQIELKRLERTGSTFCIAMIDLDRFKQVNDRFGHAAGDDVLKRFSAIVQQGLRLTDRLARYGGDEFVLVLTDTPWEIASVALERVCSSVAQHDWGAIAPGLQVTTSIGVTAIHNGDTMERALERADNALYRAKAAGRNCVHTLQAIAA